MNEHQDAHPYGRSSTDLRKRNLRQARTRRLRITQLVTFSLLVIVLAAVTYWAVGTLRGDPSPVAAGPATSAAATTGKDGVLCPEPGALPAKTGTVTVTVLNGTDTSGLAGEFTELMTKRGFTTGEPGNTGAASGPLTVVHGPGSYLAAASVGAQFDEVSYRVSEDLEPDQVQLLIGADDISLRKSAATNAALAEAAPLPEGCD